MSRHITIEVTDEVLHRAEQVAALRGGDVEAVLTEVLSTALPPLNAVSGRIGNLQLLSDVEILHLSELQPEPEWDRRLSGLLDRQQAGELTLLEGEELRAMMGEYEANLLLKSEALVEAVRRGLRPPLSP